MEFTWFAINEWHLMIWGNVMTPKRVILDFAYNKLLQRIQKQHHFWNILCWKSMNLSLSFHRAHFVHQEGGRVQGWESVCWGVLGIPLLQIFSFQFSIFMFHISNFQSSKFPVFELQTIKLSHFQLFDFQISNFQIFKFHISKFQSFKFQNLKFSNI